MHRTLARRTAIAGVIALLTMVLATGGASSLLFAQAHAQRSLLSSGNAVRGRQAFIELRCNSCHRVAEDESLPAATEAWDGPLLHDLGRETAEAVAWKIVSRSALDSEALYDEPMADAASEMTPEDLADLVAYLRDPAAGQTDDSGR